MILNLQNTKIYQITLGLILGLILFQIEYGIIIITMIGITLLYIRKMNFIIMILFTVLGFLYSWNYNESIQKDINLLISQNEELVVEVMEAPLVKEFYQEAPVKALNSNILILAKFDKYSKIKLGDKLTINPNFTLPKESKFFDRIAYLKSRKIFLESDYPQVLKVASNSGFYSAINKSKNTISNILNNFTFEPQTTLAKGLIIGDENNFNDDFKQNLRNSGLSHITSVSGYNVAIIFAGILYLNRFLNRRILLIIASLIIFIFWQIVGNYNLPTERATIMLSLGAAGLLLGRRLNIFYLVLLSTLIMLLEYPYYVQNISFQLSLGAVLGILILTPKITKVLESRNLRNIFTEIIAVTLSVLIFTIPITLITFGQTSSIALLSNIIVLPLIPALTMLLIAGIGLQILNLSPLAEIIFFISNYLLKFIITIVNTLGNLRFATITDMRIALIFFAAITFPILFLIYKNKNVQ